MPGIRIGHRTARATIGPLVHTVPIPTKPLSGQSLDMCPTCGVVHPFKTVHLWLDDAGTCIVSAGVLADLQAAGMPDLDILGEVLNPPTLSLNGGRAVQDKANRRVIQYVGRYGDSYG